MLVNFLLAIEPGLVHAKCAKCDEQHSKYEDNVQEKWKKVRKSREANYGPIDPTQPLLLALMRRPMLVDEHSA